MMRRGWFRSRRVDSVFGLFLLDLGAPSLNLNRTFLRPLPKGGVDAVAAASPNAPDTVAHAILRLGMLTIVPVDPVLPDTGSRAPNALLNHKWNNYLLCDRHAGRIDSSIRGRKNSPGPSRIAEPVAMQPRHPKFLGALLKPR